ncbi:response regulator [Paenibacillus woosongensis]|uniref:Response regulator n=1 Tax=Paenibacillus woosongensis TaxID=307580 RepID=A0AA95I031_9BACL|nr:response regulator [Paenibacillus woosongensis]WHX48029.1 response regulator [Paenibacillus woosongensis]
MYKVLIVDDEHFVRYGIKAMIDWESMGFDVVGEASNGTEGLMAFEELAPDVVISDIKMPVMDGIEFVSQVRALDRQVKLILLTCLDDFEYAQKAIRLGITDYLIKSDIMPKDLEQVMMNLKAVLDEAQSTAGHSPNKQAREESNKDRVTKEALLMGLAHGTISEAHVTEEKLLAAGLSPGKTPLILLYIGIDDLEKLRSHHSEEEMIMFHTKGMEVTREICSMGAEDNEMISGSTGLWTVLCKGITADAAGELAQRVISRISDELGLSVTLGVSSPIYTLHELRDAYLEAEHRYRLKLFIGCGIVIGQEFVYETDFAAKPVPVMNKKLNDYLYSLDREAMQQYLVDTFDHVKARLDYEGVHLISIELLLNLTNMYLELSHDHEWLYERKKELFDQIKQLETLEEIISWFVEIYEELIQKMRAVYSSDQGSIAKAVQYIEQNYDQDLSLQVLSQHVHLSKNYFSNLFKREMGEGVIDYITKVRLERAKALLRNTDLKSSEVGMLVGISDSKYFSKLFKKMTGATPSEYRDGIKSI